MKTHDPELKSSETFTVRIDAATKKRLEKLAENTGRSRSFLAAEAIAQYLDANEWQVAGIHAAIHSIDQSGGVAHDDVRRWVESWGTPEESARP